MSTIIQPQQPAGTITIPAVQQPQQPAPAPNQFTQYSGSNIAKKQSNRNNQGQNFVPVNFNIKVGDGVVTAAQINQAIVEGNAIAGQTQYVTVGQIVRALTNASAAAFQTKSNYLAQGLPFTAPRVNLGSITRVLSAAQRLVLGEEGSFDLDGTYNALASEKNALYPSNSELVSLFDQNAFEDANFALTGDALGRIRVTSASSSNAKRSEMTAQVLEGQGINLSLRDILNELLRLSVRNFDNARAGGFTQPGALSVNISTRARNVGEGVIFDHPGSMERLNTFVQNGRLANGTVFGQLILTISMASLDKKNQLIMRSHNLTVGSNKFFQVLEQAFSGLFAGLAQEQANRAAGVKTSGRVSHAGIGNFLNTNAILDASNANDQAILRAMFRLLHVSGYADVLAPLVSSKVLNIGSGATGAVFDVARFINAIPVDANGVRVNTPEGGFKNLMAALRRVSDVLTDPAKAFGGIKAQIQKGIAAVSRANADYNGLNVTEENRKQVAVQALNDAQVYFNSIVGSNALIEFPSSTFRVTAKTNQDGSKRIASSFNIGRDEDVRATYNANTSTQRRAQNVKTLNPLTGAPEIQRRAVSGFKQRNTASIFQSNLINIPGVGRLQENAVNVLLLGSQLAVANAILQRAGNLKNKAAFIIKQGSANPTNSAIVAAAQRVYYAITNVTEGRAVEGQGYTDADIDNVDATFSQLLGNRTFLRQNNAVANLRTDANFGNVNVNRGLSTFNGVGNNAAPNAAAQVNANNASAPPIVASSSVNAADARSARSASARSPAQPVDTNQPGGGSIGGVANRN